LVISGLISNIGVGQIYQYRAIFQILHKTQEGHQEQTLQNFLRLANSGMSGSQVGYTDRLS